MRYILLIIFIFLLSLPVFADYKPIERQYSAQYRTEINQIIKKEIPISKREVKKIFKEVQEEKNQNVKTVIIEQGINSIIFEFYMKLINKTDKYVHIKQDIPPTDWYGDLKIIITPYLEDNNADINKINSFLNYALEKQLELERKF